MTEVSIRYAAPGDAEGIGQVHVSAWQWAYRGLIPEEYLNELDPSRRAVNWERVLGGDQSSWPIVAVHQNQIVGFCHAARSRDDDAAPLVGEVTAIYLMKEIIGTEVGWRLWQAALSHLADLGCKEVTVWVLEDNIRGRRFYERVGLMLDGAMKSDDRRGFHVKEVRYRGAIQT